MGEYDEYTLSKQVYNYEGMDPDKMISLAQLHSIKDTWTDTDAVEAAQERLRTAANAKPQTTKKHDFQFIIDDHSTYYQLDDFRSPQAKASYGKYNQLEQSYKQLQEKLEDMRSEYSRANKQGCNKIALGHHMDDILETLLMNITYQGAFSSMPPRLVMKKFDMTIIRPMCLVHEADLMELAQVRGYRKQVKNCPYESQSSRSAMKGILKQLEEMNPEARYSLWGSMTNVQEELLPAIINH
jgi:tRNA(Ile)-lysidine synthase TilS/MesJ